MVDSGLAREPRRDSTRGMSGLVTVSCSQASAEQRAGRAARQGPGTVIRCYDHRTFAAAPAHATPEIAVADLAGAALALSCWGAPRGAGLSLPDAPPEAALDEAVRVLHDLGAVDHTGRATELGRTLARIPADPRLARALLDGAGVVGLRRAAEAVAVVSGDLRAPGADLIRLAGRAALRQGPVGAALDRGSPAAGEPGPAAGARARRRREAEALRRCRTPSPSVSSSRSPTRTGWRAA